MKTCFALLVVASGVAHALSGHFMAGPDLRHRQLAARSSPQAGGYGSRERRAMQQAKRMLETRKTPLGTGDSTTAPSNIAPGTFSASDGCTCWHTVIDGEVCLGLIDKSTAAFTLDTFYEFNPSVTSPDCGNLNTGLAYCVDNGANDISSTAAITTAAALNNAVHSKPTATTSSDTPDPTETEDCPDDSEPDDAGNDGDDGDDCPDDEEPDSSDDGDDCVEDENSDSTSSSDVSTPTPHVKAHIAATTPMSITVTPTSSADSSPSTGSDLTGIATWYTQNGNQGACGNWGQDSDLIVALQTTMYDNGSHCGAQIKITNTDTGASVTATVADECPSCGKSTDVDCSVAVFNALSGNNQGAGVETIAWSFV